MQDNQERLVVISLALQEHYRLNCLLEMAEKQLCRWARVGTILRRCSERLKPSLFCLFSRCLLLILTTVQKRLLDSFTEKWWSCSSLTLTPRHGALAMAAATQGDNSACTNSTDEKQANESGKPHRQGKNHMSLATRLQFR